MPKPATIDALVGSESMGPLRLPDWLARGLGWLSGRRRTLLGLAVLLQLGVLAGMIALHLYPLVIGNRVLLQVIPVDPRDVFRGDFVILGYDFSPWRLEKIEGLPRTPAFASNQSWEDVPVYVSLEEDPKSKHWRATRASVIRPASGVYLRGLYRPYGFPAIRAGIEAFYVEERSGHDYEKAIRDKKLFAEVAVAPSGAAKLVRLVVE